MKKTAPFLLILLLLCGSGCATSTLKWTAGNAGEKSSSGQQVLWHLEGVNNGLYLFYWIPVFCGDSRWPNRWDYEFFEHAVNEKHALRLLNCRLKQLKADTVEDVSITYRTNGWPGLGIIWTRSFIAKGKAVKKMKKMKK